MQLPAYARTFNFWWVVLLLLASVLLLLHHTTYIYLHKGFLRRPLQRLVSNLLSLLLIFLCICGLSVFIVTMVVPVDHSFCTLAAHWGPSGYSVFKLTLYSILILRFVSTFQSSEVKYDAWKLQLWASSLLVWTLANLIGINLTARNLPGTCETAKPPLPLIAIVVM